MGARRGSIHGDPPGRQDGGIVEEGMPRDLLRTAFVLRGDVTVPQNCIPVMRIVMMVIN